MDEQTSTAVIPPSDSDLVDMLTEGLAVETLGHALAVIEAARNELRDRAVGPDNRAKLTELRRQHREAMERGHAAVSERDPDDARYFFRRADSTEAAILRMGGTIGLEESP